jgi:two-component system, NtrC family, nitrogen regulation sensor histidine kinase GlnL
VLIDPQSPLPPKQHRSVPYTIEDGGRVSRQPAIENVRQLPAFLDTLLRAKSLSELTDIIPGLVARYLGCRRVLLYAVHDNALVWKGSSEESPDWSSTSVHIGSIVPIPLSSGAPEAEALRLVRLRVLPTTADRPYHLIAPLRGIGGPVGVLVLVPSADEQAWGNDQLRPSAMHIMGLEDIAKIISIVLENAQLLEDDHKRVEVIDLLMRLTTALNNNVLDVEAIKMVIETQIGRVTHADFCTVIVSGGPWQAQGRDQWLHPEIIRAIQHMRVPFLIDNIHERPWPLASLLPESLYAFYAVPLLVEDRVVGVLALAFNTEHLMDSSERDLLMILANSASTFLQRARLNTENEQARLQTRSMLERIQNEERIKDAILWTMHGGLISVDLEGRVTLVNRQAIQLLKLNEQNIIGQPIEDVLPVLTPGLHPFRSLLGSRLSPIKREVRIRTTDNIELPVEMSVSMLRQTDGKDMGVVGSFQDISHIRALEEEIRRLDSVAAVRTEASEIAHDMRNMLQGIRNGLYELFGPIDDGNPETREAVAIVRKEINRLTALADNMMNLAKPKTPQLKPCNAQELIEDILHVLQHRIELAQIEVITHFESGAMLLADELQVKRAIENLCINAIEAMAPGGALTLATRTTRSGLSTFRSGALNQQTITDRPALPYGSKDNNGTELLMPDLRQRAVEITITDTGKGIPEERLNEIWKPFSTFDKRGGTGLGLSIARQVVEAHGGMITVTSTVGIGTTFALRLPGLR